MFRKKNFTFILGICIIPNISNIWTAFFSYVDIERMIAMIQHKIKLRPDEIRDFVSVACRTDIDIDISYNRYTVDAKSILGVLGLDLTQALTVTCHGYDKDFEEYLNHFSIAC